MTARCLPFPFQIRMWGHAEWGTFRLLDQAWEDPGTTYAYNGWRLWDRTADELTTELLHDPDGRLPVPLWWALPYVAVPPWWRPGGRL